MRKGHNLRIITFWDAYTGPTDDIERHRMVARQNLQAAIQREIDKRGQGALIGTIHEKIEPGMVTWSQKAAWIVE